MKTIKLSIKINKNNLFVFCMVAVLFLLIFNPVFAASAPQFLTSWKAYNYTPDWYQGKSFPVYSTPVEVAFELYYKSYLENSCIETYLYSGVADTLKYLKQQGYKLAICTNKPLVFIEPILKKLDIKQYFGGRRL